MKIRQIMTADPATCGADASLQRAAQEMVDCDCGVIPVVDDQGRPVGVVTDRDIVCRAVAKGRNPLELRVRDVMTTPIVTLSPEASLEECARMLEEHQIRRAIIVDEQGRCCGIVTQADIALKAGPEKAAEVLREVSQPTDSASLVH
jgi:CBS domain-containing protein